MKTSDIAKSLFGHFQNYEYKLSNSYVFNWESDFFAMSKSGYCMEVEVKVSRSDFFADFKKEEKHRMLKDRFDKKEYFIYRFSDMTPAWESLIVEYETSTINFQFGENNWRYDWESKKYIVNDYGKAFFRKRRVSVYAPHTRINIRPFSEIKTPHYLYYCCPDGLIKPTEVPTYTGLLYCGRYGIKVVKKAPFIHKENMNMNAILLDKFYYLSINLKNQLSALLNRI